MLDLVPVPLLLDLDAEPPEKGAPVSPSDVGLTVGSRVGLTVGIRVGASVSPSDVGLTVGASVSPSDVGIGVGGGELVVAE